MHVNFQPHSMNLLSKKMIKNIIKSVSAAMIMFSFSHCGSNPNSIIVTKTDGYQQNHGPFDSNGNYVENWADDPPERKFKWAKSLTKKKEQTIASTPTPKPAPLLATNSNRTIAQVPTPTRTYTPSVKKSTSPETGNRVAKTKSTAKKITPKTKPPIIHTVKKGDTLYGIGLKYGASVSAIQIANRISGSNISIGKKLIIPRK